MGAIREKKSHVSNIGYHNINHPYFLNYTTKFGRDYVINRILGTIWVADKWQGYLPGNYNFLDWSQDWDPLRPSEEATFMGSHWHKAMVVNEGKAASRQHLSLSNVSIAFLTRLSWSNINFWIASKLGEHGDGPLLSCTNFVGWGLETIIFFLGNKSSSGKRFINFFVRNIKNWCLLCGITIWTIWIEHNDKVFNQEQWHQSKFKHLIWDNPIICMPKWFRRGWLNLLSAYSDRALLKSFDQTWGARNILCGGDKMRMTWDWKSQCTFGEVTPSYINAYTCAQNLYQGIIYLVEKIMRYGIFQNKGKCLYFNAPYKSFNNTLLYLYYQRKLERRLGCKLGNRSQLHRNHSFF